MQCRVLVDKAQLLHYRVVLQRLGELDLAKSQEFGWIKTCAGGLNILDATTCGV